MLSLLVACTDSGSGSIKSEIAQTREELLTYVIDIPNSDGHRYGLADSGGHVMDAIKVIQISETNEFAAVYHWWDETSQSFTSSLATSENLLDWAWKVDLGAGASMPSIAEAEDGGYVVAWEDDAGPNVSVRYYPDREALLAAEPTKIFTAERQLSDCAEGTPNIYSASSESVDIGLHYYADCSTDRQARAQTDWSTWDVEPQPLLDRAALFQGYRGSIGDRDFIDYQGFEFTFLEAQFTQDDWRTFRILLYDDNLGKEDRAGFPSAPAVPPSMHVFLHTHEGSSSFTNFTITEVTFEGRKTLVMGVFIPSEGAANNEAGELIYYRFLD